MGLAYTPMGLVHQHHRNRGFIVPLLLSDPGQSGA